MVEIFSDRIEFSNAGAPLVAIERIVDTVPLSRNENMAGFMHRCGICEERGSGFDKVIAATRAESLIAPKVENQNNQFTKVTLYSRVDFDMTTKEDRVRTCYMILELFLRNILLNEKNELKNRYLHVRWKTVKQDIEDEKQDIEMLKQGY